MTVLLRAERRRMAPHEEQHPKCCNSGGGSDGSGSSRSSKKNKQKKIPQRGLGVAQLEKLRLEEQQKSAATSSPANLSQGLHLLSSHQPSLPFVTANDLNPLPGPVIDSTPLFKPPIPMSPTDPALPHALESSIAGSAVSAGHGFLPMLWNSMEPSPHDAEAAAARRFGFRAPLQSNPSSPSWRSSVLLQWRQQQQQPISMVSRTLSPSSSGVGLQMEPPSNQNHNGYYNMPSSWPEEERMVGMKRPWPFHLDNMAGQNSFPSKIPSFSSYLNPEGCLSMYTNDLPKCESRGTAFRRGILSSYVDSKSFGLNHDKSNKENEGTTDGGFLTLAPSFAPSTSKPKPSMVIPPSCHGDHPEIGYQPNQGIAGDSCSLQPPFYSFLPMGSNTCETNLSERRIEALDGGVDLNLKL